MVSKISKGEHAEQSPAVEKKLNKNDFSMIVSKKFKDEKKKHNGVNIIGVTLPQLLHNVTLNKAEGGFTKNEKTSASKDNLAADSAKLHHHAILSKTEVDLSKNDKKSASKDNLGVARLDSERRQELYDGLALKKTRTNDYSRGVHNESLKKTQDDIGLIGSMFGSGAQHFSNSSENAKKGSFGTSLSDNKSMASAMANHVTQGVKSDDALNINYNFNRWEGKPTASVRVPGNSSIDSRIIVTTSNLETKDILIHHSKLFIGDSTLYIEQPKDGEDKRDQNHYQHEEDDE